MDHKESTDRVVTRFAPSPTGYMHIGGVRTALFAYLWARKNQGTFILRIEDTDKSREVAGSIEHIMESLRWLGITWDFGPDKPGKFISCLQSDRLAIYRSWAEKLITKGLAYPDPYTDIEIEAFRQAAQAEKRPYLYRDHRPNTFETWDGTKPLRLKVPTIKRYIWHDTTRGELTAGEEMLDDFVLIKSDGYPTYNFAHIIDDFEMGVTHIMRADEFISSTPKFLSLYDALEIPYPVFVTLPPILREDRTKKLGKRDGAKDILEYRKEGFLPEAMMNFLALIGWNPGTDQELFTPEELITAFEPTKIQRAGATFNEEKLLWMNKQYLARLSPTKQLAYIRAALPTECTTAPQYDSERLSRLIPTILERTHVAKEISDAALAGEFDFAFITPEYDSKLLQWKSDRSPIAALPRLREVLRLLTDANFDSAANIKSVLWPYAETTGKGEVLWPTRVALSGRERSPDPFILAYVLGRAETLRRLKSACDKLDSDASNFTAGL